jgi:hypothetical protein
MTNESNQLGPVTYEITRYPGIQFVLKDDYDNCKKRLDELIYAIESSPLAKEESRENRVSIITKNIQATKDWLQSVDSSAVPFDAKDVIWKYLEKIEKLEDQITDLELKFQAARQVIIKNWPDTGIDIPNHVDNEIEAELKCMKEKKSDLAE